MRRRATRDSSVTIAIRQWTCIDESRALRWTGSEWLTCVAQFARASTWRMLSSDVADVCQGRTAVCAPFCVVQSAGERVQGDRPIAGSTIPRNGRHRLAWRIISASCCGRSRAECVDITSREVRGILQAAAIRASARRIQKCIGIPPVCTKRQTSCAARCRSRRRTSTSMLQHIPHILPEPSAFIPFSLLVPHNTVGSTFPRNLRQYCLRHEANVSLTTTSTNVQKLCPMYIQVLKRCLPLFRKVMRRQPNLHALSRPILILRGSWRIA